MQKENEIMIKKKIIKVTLLAFTVSALTACGGTNTAEKGKSDTPVENDAVASYATATVENGEIVIDTNTLTAHPLYINYDSNGTNIQLIAVNASDGSSRLSLNTCQVCNPSPRAYFKEENGRLVCQNCGNVFTMDSVGESSGGCNPMNIAYGIADDNLTVNAADLDNYADKFASWSGTVE